MGEPAAGRVACAPPLATPWLTLTALRDVPFRWLVYRGNGAFVRQACRSRRKSRELKTPGTVSPKPRNGMNAHLARHGRATGVVQQ
jgi:hypothetical protein